MGKNILVVDDDFMNLKLAERILAKQGYQVYKANSGMQCLACLQQQPIDLVLLDIEMPVLNGIQTLEKIRSCPGMETLPVAFLTADADSKTVATAAALKAIAYIKKPFMPQVLQEKVAGILGQ